MLSTIISRKPGEPPHRGRCQQWDVAPLWVGVKSLTQGCTRNFLSLLRALNQPLKCCSDCSKFRLSLSGDKNICKSILFLNLHISQPLCPAHVVGSAGQHLVPSRNHFPLAPSWSGGVLQTGQFLWKLVCISWCYAV